MCFYIHDDHKKEKIAKKPIMCWKIFEKFKGEKEYFSPHRSFPYRKGTLYYAKIKKDTLDRINDGIHCYSTKSRAYSSNWYNTSKVLECTIPVGAKYYYNPEDKEYVSDHLYIGKIDKINIKDFK